jgi:hypothetical protein
MNEGGRAICGGAVDADPRWHPRIGGRCLDRACDADGRPVRSWNTGHSGGLSGGYVDREESYDHAFCVVDGVACGVSEGRFGVVGAWRLG